MDTVRLGRVRAVLLAGIVATGATIAFASSAHAADPTAPSSSVGIYPPPTPCATTILDGTFVAGGTLKIESTGFVPGGPAQIWLHSSPVLLLDTTADSTGTITATVQIPSNLAPGKHTLLITMPNRTCTLSLNNGGSGVEPTQTTRSQPTLGVDATTSARGESLAFTGVSTLTSLVVVVVLLGSGVLFLVLGRRRRRT